MTSSTASALVVGEALVDVRHEGGTVSEHAGGSPANVAVGLARLGRATALLTDLGDDRYGDLLAHHLEAEDVALLAPQRPGARTSSAIAEVGTDGSATYTFDLHWTPATPPALPDACVVHTGSLGAVLEPGADTVVALLERLAPTATVTYDLNIRLAAMGPHEEIVQRVDRVARLADVVKASDEDLDLLWPGEPLLEAAGRLLRPATSAVVVTRGAAGALCLTHDGVSSVPAPQIDVADTIGAGDSFCAALIDRLWQLGALGSSGRAVLRSLDEANWGDVLTWAATAAAVTVSRPGADPPTRAELVACRGEGHETRLAP